MSTLLRIGFTVLVLPSIITVIVYLTDSILTFEISETIGNVMGAVDYVIGTRTTNLILIAVATILIIQIARRIFRFISGNLDKDDK